MPSFRYRRRTSRSSSRSTEARGRTRRAALPAARGGTALSPSRPLGELSMYALARDSVTESAYSPEHEAAVAAGRRRQRIPPAAVVFENSVTVRM
ncbi:hypothetical protein CRUP_027820 [Coryphaenoides rupestris]|nr:hypothetical protein CRUP_027820 [Coryphaenoides rupestris]